MDISFIDWDKKADVDKYLKQYTQKIIDLNNEAYKKFIEENKINNKSYQDLIKKAIWSGSMVTAKLLLKDHITLSLTSLKGKDKV